MTVLLLGGRGYIGTAFRKHLERRGIEYLSLSRMDQNYCDPVQLDELIAEARPDFLINAAGMTGRPNVDLCESAKSECLHANAVLPGLIRQVCERRKLPWGHVSSGCIYTGSNCGRPFTESDCPNFSFRHNNCSFYSGCKALGEEMLEGAQLCYVWRPRMPFNHVDAPKNYLSKLLRYERLLDVRNSLSHVGQFVDACIDCIVKNVDYGTYNLTNSGSVTTREVVKLIKQRGITEKVFKFFCSEDEFMRTAAIAPRSNCELDNQKALNAGLHLTHVLDALDQSIAKWQPM